ncbi:hypothetical protein D9619_008727 [Psilocybe cf. subviscida]|uniref:Uncharacterized protein n=1 Tax=Psilocybe cf. subviscida TaxID=2480587 RepID=A0A8H5F0X2_9AGAR|nr:hypothetical protein D9619_008727 [Psilocybe cf. subviscida]
MAVVAFPLPVPQFIQRKLDRGRAKLDACTPLVLLRRRLAEADTGCAPPPASDDRLSLPMLLERHGRWSTALMCGAVEEVAMGLLVYKNGPVPVCDQSLPKARIAAQKVVLTACNLLFSTSTELVERGVDAVQCVKENSVVLAKMSPTMPHSLPGVAVIRSLDNTFSNKNKVNAAIRAFLDSRVNARILRAHACFFDAAEDLVRWHKILRVPHPRSQGQDQLQLQLRSALCAMPGRAKLAVQRTWTAASVWALCAALSHASAANMVLAIVMGSDDFMDEEESVEEEKAEDGAPALVHEVHEPTKLDTDGSTISTGKPKKAIGTQEDANNEAAGAQSQDEAIKNALSKLRARPASFITSRGNKYRVKMQTREDELASTRRRVVVKASLQGKGSKAKEAVLGISVRVPAERLREGARVVVSKEKGKTATRDGVEGTKILNVAVPMEAEVPAIQPTKKDTNAEVHERVQPTCNDAEVTASVKKKSLRRGAAETIGRLSWRLMSRAATILPEAVVAAGSAAIVKGSSALGLDDALGLQTYYKWEEGPAVIGPWGSQGRWALVADNCPPPSPPPRAAAKSDASAYASGGAASGLDDIESSNAANTEGDTTGGEVGAVKDKEKTTNEVDVSTEGVEKPAVGDSELSADSIPKASVEPPTKVETACSDAKASKEVNPNEDSELRMKFEAQTPLRLPLDRYPRPRLSWFALQAGLQSVRDVIKSVRGRGKDLWQDGAAGMETNSEANFDSTTPMLGEDGYMAESESFDDFVDHKKSGGLADSESFGEFSGSAVQCGRDQDGTTEKYLIWDRPSSCKTTK